MAILMEDLITPSAHQVKTDKVQFDKQLNLLATKYSITHLAERLEIPEEKLREMMSHAD